MRKAIKATKRDTFWKSPALNSIPKVRLLLPPMTVLIAMNETEVSLSKVPSSPFFTLSYYEMS